MADENTIDPELLSQFLEDAEQTIAPLDGLLDALEQNPEDKDTVKELFRISHNIKGNSGYMNFEKTNKLAHTLENLLLQLREKDGIYTAEIGAVLRQGFDRLRTMMSRLKEDGGEKVDDATYADFVAGVDELVENIKKSDVLGLWESLTKDFNLFAEKFASEDPQMMDLLSKMMFSVGSLSQFFEHEKERKQEEKNMKEASVRTPSATERKGGRACDNNSPRLEEIKTVFPLLKAACQAKPDERDAALENLKWLMVNMVAEPVSKVFGKAPMIVKDVAEKQNKLVEVQVSGGDVLLEKHIVSALENPVTHILRNSVDHGIEPPQERKARNKPERGLIKINAFTQDNEVRIVFSDDGGGIDTDAVKWKAIAKGMMDAQKASKATEQEILSVLFMPGFSTSEMVTDISGRGVGMDVVKSTVEELGGKFALTSKLGAGTELVIMFPKPDYLF